MDGGPDKVKRKGDEEARERKDDEVTGAWKVVSKKLKYVGA